MTSWGSAPYELNGGEGAITIVGRDPGAQEVKQGRPFVGPAGQILDDVLNEAGIRRSDVNILNVSRHRPPVNKFEAHGWESLDAEIRHLRSTLLRLKPSIIVTLGAHAAHALVPEWPDAPNGEHRGRIKSARDIENRRGYIFDTIYGPVLTSVHPAAVARTWAPWRMLLSYDFQRAQEISVDGFERPHREVEIIGSDRDCRHALRALRKFRRLSADIETWRDTSLACIGFAGESGKAYVFPARYAARTEELLRNPRLTTVWANGIYDLFVLKHREGWDIRCQIEDVQLAWHACYPELAGAKEGRARHTRKSLSFLASLCTYDPWWKGDYSTDEEFFRYNGKDCCITHDVDVWVQEVVDEVGARATYDHERALMMPCVDMLERGLAVDETERARRVVALEERVAEVWGEANDVVVPLLERERARLETMHLFEETDPTCKCCGHGKKKQLACWSCVGFEKAPTKAEMAERFDVDPKSMSKAEMEEKLLPICHVCAGAPRETRTVFNPNSSDQSKVVLYEVLRLPKRFKRNTKGESVLTTDEKALKSLAGYVEGAIDE